MRYDRYAYVIISKYRIRTLLSLGDGKLYTPTQISKNTGIRTNHISKVLGDLKRHQIIECVNESARKGRLYKITDFGSQILDDVRTYYEENK